MPPKPPSPSCRNKPQHEHEKGCPSGQPFSLLSGAVRTAGMFREGGCSGRSRPFDFAPEGAPLKVTERLSFRVQRSGIEESRRSYIRGPFRTAAKREDRQLRGIEKSPPSEQTLTGVRSCGTSLSRSRYGGSAEFISASWPFWPPGPSPPRSGSRTARSCS